MRVKGAAVGLILAIHAAAAAAQGDSEEWQFQITPYIWLPTIGADLNFDPPPGGGSGGGGGANVDVGPTDWLELINGAMLINAGAQKGRFSLTTDLVFLSLESDKDRVRSVLDDVTIPGTPVPLPIEGQLNLATQTDFDGMVWTTVIGYSLQQTERSAIDLIAGARLLDLEASVAWNLTADITTPGGELIFPAQGTISQDDALWDAVVGVRGQFALGEGKWSVPFYLDAGTGDTDLTWQAMAGFTYSYGWGDLMLVYRHMEFSQGSGEFFEELSFGGPGIGARFRF